MTRATSDLTPSTTLRLLDRARSAAKCALDADPDFDRRDSSPHRVGYRRRVASAFATAYGLDIADVIVTDDPVRAEWQAARIAVTTAGRTWQFIALPGTSNVFLVLGPCPSCGRTVPLAETADLPAFGRYLDSPHTQPQPLEFTYDPGHALGCQHPTIDDTQPRARVAVGRS